MRKVLVLVALIIGIVAPVARAAVPPVPAGFQLVDLIANNDFEDPAAPLGLEPLSPAEGTVAHTTIDPIAGTGSLKVTVNGWGGRVIDFLPYGYGSGPFARSVTLAAKLRVDSATPAGKALTACAWVYFLDDSVPLTLCQDFSVDPATVVDVFLSIDTQDRQLNYVYPQFTLNDSGTVEATVDDLHYYVVQPEAAACTADTWSCTEFSACGADGTQTRTCTMTFDCPNVVTPSPATTQSCTPPGGCTADIWSCTEFSACGADGTQTRTCTMTFDCPNAVTPSPETTQACTPPPPGGGPTNPSRQGGRYVAMMSPTNGERFWAPGASLRLVAQGFDPNVSTNDPGPGRGQNAAQVEFFVDGNPVLTVSGTNAEYSVFKGYADTGAITPGQHIVWARATYVSPALVLDSAPSLITIDALPTYAQTIDLTEDVVLSAANPSYELLGTPTGRIRLNGNGFQIRGTGDVTLRNVDVYDLGSRTNTLAAAVDVASSGSVIIESSVFDSSNQVSLQFNGAATASIRGNTFRSNSRIPIGQQPFEPDTAYIVKLSGASTGTKTFAGNNVAAGAVGLVSASHWMLGGTTNADSNVLIGARAAFEVQSSSDITIEGNFVRNVYYGGWSQGQLMELWDTTSIKVLHNVLIGSSWPVRGIAGELAYNLIANGGHTSVLPGPNANIHHNLFVGSGLDGGDCVMGIIGGVYDFPNIRVVNNTFDGLNTGFIIAGVFMQNGQATVRSNTFLNLPLIANDPNATTVNLNATATIDADYNAFHGPRGTYSDGRVPPHDVVSAVNPSFTGPLPVVPFDRSEVAVWNRQLSVGAVLADYRDRYTPAAGNPLVDQGDPSGGAGNDIGAIGAGAPNALDLFGTFGSTGVSPNPTMPQNLYAAGISANAAHLKWSASTTPAIPGQTQKSISGYRIFRDGVQIATVNALRYEDTGLAPNTTYSYAVVAIDNAGKASPAASATASTIPTMSVGTSSSHPVLLSPARIAALAAGGPSWNALKQSCDSRLETIIQPGYAGWDWHDAAIAFSTCYRVAKLQGDTLNAEKYERKALALAVVLARHHNSGTPDAAQQPAGLADGSRTTFPLPFAPMSPAAINVSLIGTKEIQLTRAATGNDNLATFAPIMKISNEAGGAPAYPASSYELRYRDGLDLFRLAWVGGSQPAPNAAYFVTVAEGNSTSVASGFTVDAANLTITFTTAPAANQAVMVSYLGSAYEQTGNGLGGLNSVQPDGPGYPMRTFNPGLATAYDALHDSGLLTPALRAEFYGIMNRQVDWCSRFCYENDGRGGQVGNYFIRGLLGSTFATAYATDQENPLAAQLKTQANALLAQMYEGVVKYLPGGYGPQGQYANGTTIDILETLSLYRDVTSLDLAPRLDWTHNVVAATIHGTKPDLASFYDGGDWDALPASPLDAAMQAFLQSQPDHAAAPFARKLVQELGQTPASSGSVADYRLTFPLSFFGQGSPFYARSDWGSNAVWMSLTANDTGAVAHQHKDAGHLTINRGGDYLLKNAGGYGYMDTLYHNTLLIDDRNIPGYSPVIVYPPDQGWWGRESQLTKHAEADAYAYSQADFADSYVNNDGVRNSVTRALRSAVFLRPRTIVLFDQVQVAHPAVRKTFNVNFAGPVALQSGAWSTTVNQSRLFMQSLLNDVTPVTSSLSGPNGQTSTNFQETLSGSGKDVFLHVFEATDAGAAAMAASHAMRSVDRNVQGVEVTAGGKQWAVLFAAYDRAFGGNVQYVLPAAGAHSHLLHDLMPSTPYTVSVTDAQGNLQRAFATRADDNGTVSFDTNDGETHLYVTPGATAPATIPPVTTDPNA